MKKRWYTALVSIICTCILLPMLTSCKQNNPTPPSSGEDETGKTNIGSAIPSSSGIKAAKNMAEEVMGYLKARDVEALKAVFCEELKNRDDFDEKIDEMMNLLDGEIIAYRDISGPGERGDTWETIQPQLIEIETNTGKEERHDMMMSVYIKNEDPGKVGVYQLFFTTLGGTEDDEERTVLNSITLEIGTINWD